MYRLLYLEAPPIPFKQIVELYSSQEKDIYFIEVGACSGKDFLTNFIRRNNWSGILVEPVKYIFDFLMEDYKCCKNLSFENVAIANIDGSKDIYYLKKEFYADSEIKDKLPLATMNTYFGLGSFYPEIILSYIIPEAKKYLIKGKTICCTLKTLLDKYNVKKINLVYIDTEGYDFEIIKLINFKEIRPDIIMYEHVHLKREEYTECIRYLKKNKYILFQEDNNVLALSASLKIL